MDPIIVPATPGDVSVIVEMIRELAGVEGRPQLAMASEQQIHQALFGNPARAEAVMIQDIPGRNVGYGWFFTVIPTFIGAPNLYLEDLYLRPAARKTGLGTGFMRWLARMALERGCRCIEWSAQPDNVQALAFYDRLGATRKDPPVEFRLSDEALRRVANGR